MLHRTAMIDYRTLDVYQDARVLARDLFRIILRLPLWLRWRLGAQLDDAVESIGSNLAEGSGRKNVAHGNTELIRYGHMAHGSACEVEHRIQGLRDRELISASEHADLADRIGHIKARLLRLISAWKRADRGKLDEL
ncbi:MAG: four helix bundle protein [Gemmatimonadaceae bacterium]